MNLSMILNANFGKTIDSILLESCEKCVKIDENEIFFNILIENRK